MTRQGGFTLVEMVMAIVITGIVAGIVAVFIAKPVEGYVSTARRAGMTDVADLALKRMALDIRTAVPNTVRIAGAGRFLEFIPARTGGRYCTDSDSGCNPLDFATADLSFDVLGEAHDAAENEFLVIYNTGQTGLNAYLATDNRRTIAAGTTTTAITFAGTSFPFASPSSRFQVVPVTGPVTYACEGVGGAATGTGSLRRYTGYGFNGTQPTTGLGTGALLADNLTGCIFTYGAVSATNGMVSLQLTVTRENESISLFHQIHVDNAP
ncbi:type II secretion system protein [Sulfuritalea hydrogenivorans]|jgi:MSHA biogenesis protein MshO|uniref:General secretion pathway protein H n=1 Tax=Sulfuritalea hydrogenivorans sk43H TaxID=1223802 RepID=W0SBP0_9PROT|nr:type II secretion system protein [Sulfuritalea hydrogenivorans]MDK9715940.1 type II secretion system GspH family protein [Sulfuritalea sp.]BAO28639.1 general secretion pathway protein H [Sulfuritalea hydrogenivorans sk43H]